MSLSAPAAAALAALEAAGDSLERYGSALVAPFAVRHLAQARLLWLNTRWLRENGIEIDLPEIGQAVTDHIMARFAVQACALPAEAGDTLLFADRYGGSHGAPHGGSGRSGGVGGLNAKGVGRTPLVSFEVDALHSSGVLFLHEAVREAINAELADAELPRGALPVIAIIDTGLAACAQQGGQPERLGIVVRPNRLRPAHFERSIFFGDAGTETSAQFLDAVRVRQVIETVTADAAPTDYLASMFRRIGEQYGAARAHRLWPGRFLTSNITVSGALVDFGAFRAVSSWRRGVGVPMERFGWEQPFFNQAITSLAFYFSRYAGAGPVKAERVSRGLQDGLAAGFDTAITSLVADDDAVDDQAIIALLTRYYTEQQQQHYGFDDPAACRAPWLHEALAPDEALRDRATPDERAVALSLTQLLSAGRSGRSLAPARMARFRHWLTPRPGAAYEVAVRRIKAFTGALGGTDDDAARVSRFIAITLARTRRYWPDAPNSLQVRRHLPDLDAIILTGTDHIARTHGVWIEAPITPRGLRARGVDIPPEAIDAQIDAQGLRARAWLPAQHFQTVLSDLGAPALPRAAWREAPP